MNRLHPRSRHRFLSSSFCAAAIFSAVTVGPVAIAQTPKPEESKPLFRAVLLPEGYASRVKALEESLLDPEKIEADKSPQWGIEIKSVAPGSMAEKAGLGPQWVLMRCNERELWHSTQSLDVSQEKREFVAVSPAGKEQTFHFGPGLLGVLMVDKRRPELTVIRDIPKGPWIPDILAAAQAWIYCDEELAETAMNHAVAKGMPANPISDFYAALIAADHGDRVQARTLCDAVLETVARGGSIPRFYREGMRTLAVSLNDMKLLARASEELKGCPSEITADDIRNYEERGANKMQESLLAKALAGAGEDVMSKAVFAEFLRDKIQDYAPHDILGGHINPSMEPGKYLSILFQGPQPMHDLIWEIRGVYGEKPETGTRHFVFGLVDAKLRNEQGVDPTIEPRKWTVASVWANANEKLERSVGCTIGTDTGSIETHRFFPRLTAGEPRSLNVT